MSAKKYFLSLLIINFLISGTAFAHDEKDLADTLPAQAIIASDLDAENPGLLPTNPFYFLKEFRRSLARIFTFNPVSKAELELKITDEKAAELKKVEEASPDDKSAIEKALGNYQKSQVRLKEKVESLKDTSQNPNLDSLLEKLADRIVKHEKLVEEINKKFEGEEEIQSLVSEVNKKSEEISEEAGRNDLQFSERLKKADFGGLEDELRAELNKLSKEIVEFQRLLEEFGLTKEKNPKEFSFLENAQKYSDLARESFSGKDSLAVRSYIKQAKDWLSQLSSVKEEVNSSIKKIQPEIPEPAMLIKLEEVCAQQFDPVCGIDGKTYSNGCSAKVAGINIAYKGECAIKKEEVQPVSISEMPVSAIASEEYEFKLEADDFGFYPGSVLSVPKGSKVKIHFIVKTEKVYYGGLDFRSVKFKTDSVKPGGSVTVEFVADESFVFTSYWPVSSVVKANGKVVAE